MDLVDLFPPLGLRIEAGPLVLEGITDELLLGLGDVAARGIHPPELMPFLTPWTDAPAGELPARIARYQWGLRGTFSVERWSIELAVSVDGELVGIQSLTATDFLVTRSVGTGSWLALARQGRGIGTAMRRAVCAFAFDHLDAVEVTSSAFADNPASMRVSTKVGYRPNGSSWRERRPGERAREDHFVLTPEALVRDPHPLVVSGLEPVRRAIGLS